MNCNGGKLYGPTEQSATKKTSLCATTGMSTTSHEMKLWGHNCLLHTSTCGTARPGGHRSPMRTATGESPWSAEQQDRGNEPLHHDGDVDDLSKPAMHKPLPKTTTSAASTGSARCIVTSKNQHQEELHERRQRLDSLQWQAVVQGCRANID